MKTYTLSLSTLIDVSYNAYGTNVVDKTNLARVKWFVNWAQFFKYEDHGKNCKVKVKLYSKKTTLFKHDDNLGFLTCSLPSSSGNNKRLFTHQELQPVTSTYTLTHFKSQE